MKTIKFRGYWIHGGSFIFGIGVTTDSTGTYIVDDNLDRLEVDPESVARFVGCDADGKELYEGDQLDNADGLKLTAKLISVVSLDDDICDDFFNEMTKQNDWKLKDG